MIAVALLAAFTGSALVVVRHLRAARAARAAKAELDRAKDHLNRTFNYQHPRSLRL